MRWRRWRRKQLNKKLKFASRRIDAGGTKLVRIPNHPLATAFDTVNFSSVPHPLTAKKVKKKT
jgi:hypothetical protein